ncbi:hypothetical protein ACFQPA_04755 [Halomarina halobia]|uniref:hypothetical protein n=1 Tax=Halomarina halobia TaxID=3033386 RepID=UPI0023E8F2EA|nr:hypothetical protein [Halomarina sp. PSR21]
MTTTNATGGNAARYVDAVLAVLVSLDPIGVRSLPVEWIAALLGRFGVAGRPPPPARLPLAPADR